MRQGPLTAVVAGSAVLVLACAAGAALVLTGATAGATTGAAVPPAPDATADAAVAAADTTASVTLDLASDSSLERGLMLNVGFGGGDPTEVMIDTGSTGIVVGQRLLGDDVTHTGETFSDFTYSSSGNSYSGEWVIAPVRLYSGDATGASVDTVPIRIRMVTSECESGKACVTDPDSIGVAMMGVGFDRVDPHGTTVDPSVNPFLNVTGMQSGGSMTPGYIISTGQVTLGITDDATAGFSFIPLQKLPADQGDDWQAPTTCLSVPTAEVAPQCGDLLVDTGLGYAIVQVPAGIDPPQQQGTGATAKRQVLDAGQQVVVTSPDLGGRVVYSFTVGDPSTGAPPDVAWGHDIAIHQNQPFMNVSRYPLSQLDYAYDAGGGRLGFRFHGAS